MIKDLILIVAAITIYVSLIILSIDFIIRELNLFKKIDKKLKNMNKKGTYID